MPTGTFSEQIPAASSDVFRLLHDYKRRLEWDTLLQSAYLEAGYDEANINAVSVCTGKWQFGGMAIRTRYVAFRPGSLAAVQMINSPPLFESFAASIRHRDVPIQIHDHLQICIYSQASDSPFHTTPGDELDIRLGDQKTLESAS